MASYDFMTIPSNFRFPEADNRLLDAIKHFKSGLDQFGNDRIFDREYQNFLFSDKKKTGDSRASPHVLQYDYKDFRLFNPEPRVVDHYFIKHYSDNSGNDRYKLIFMSSVKTKGVEDERIHDQIPPETFVDDQGYKYSEKLESSILRAKKRIFDLAFCNEWEYFFTGTISAEHYNREDLDKFHKDFTKWVGNTNSYYKLNIKFLIIPEKHADGKSWHLHGFIMGLPDELMEEYHREDYWSIDNKDLPKLPKDMISQLEKGVRLWKWLGYEKKFGWCSLSKIRNKDAVSAYCLKYITKDLLMSVQAVGAHSYFRSRKLREPDLVQEGKASPELVQSVLWDCENEFCKLKWLSEDELQFFGIGK